jgi:AraC family cel operon transcriptional repressor
MSTLIPLVSVCPAGEPVHVKDTRLSGQYRTFVHTHDFHEFFVVCEGTVRHHINGTTVDMPVGTLCLTEPADEHCFQCHPGSPAAVFTNVAFARELYEQVLEMMPLAPARLNPKSPPLLSPMEPALAQRFRTHTERLQALDPLSYPEQRLLVIDLLVGIHTQLLLQDRAEGSGPEREAPAWLRSAVRLMAQKENFVAGLPRFVQLCGKSQEHVSRCVRRFYGVPPTALVNRLRLAEASRLLRNTDMKVLPLALSTGFSNMSYFLQLFRNRYGCTPSAYRRRHRLVVDPADLGREAS